MRRKSYYQSYDSFNDQYNITADEVIETRESTFTGLYDERGNPLHRVKEPIGFKLGKFNGRNY